RDDASLRASADRVADAVAALHRRNDPGASLASAPRRTLTLALPEDATLAVRQRPPRLVARLADGPPQARSLPVRVQTCGDDATLDGRLTLAYVDLADGPVVLALRGFIRVDAATGAHACTPRPVRDGRPRLRV
ncbi:MAG: hypothetical protein ABEH83_07280, partial [Halobacterium sp.]